MSCKAPGLSQDESGIELTHYSTSESLKEGATSELNLAEAYEQLERMKQRVLQMKSMIVRLLPKETTTDQGDTKQAESKNVQMREIQQETAMAFQQIGPLKSRLKETIEELDILTARIQESELCSNKLAKNLEEVPKWMEEQKHQLGMCLERHNDLDTTYCSYLDYSNRMRPLKMSLKNKFSSKIPMRCYQMDYNEALEHLTRTRNLLDQARNKLMKYTQIMNDSLSGSAVLHSLPDITGLTGLLRHSQLLEKHQRQSLNFKTRTSFKLIWGGTAAKQVKKQLLTAQR